MSIPGTDDQKATLLNCQGCHTLERIMRSTHDSDEWTHVIARMMGYGAVSQPIKPQRMLNPNRQGPTRAIPQDGRLSGDHQSELERPLVVRARRRCRVRRAATPAPSSPEYDMVRPTTEPHDILVDKDGMVWYTDFGEMFIGKFDPKTLKLTEYPIKKFKDKAPTGLLSIEFDHTGKIWFDTMHQGSLGSLDPKTGEIGYYPLPPEYNDDRVQLNFTGLRYDVDGKVWTKRRRHPAHLPARSGDQHLGAVPPARPAAAQRPACRHLSGHSRLQEQPLDGRIHRRPSRQDRCEDVASDLVRHAHPEGPCPPHADRRAGPHPGDRVSHQQGRAVRHQTEKYLAEYSLPPYTFPDRANFDKNGELWASTMSTDRVVRHDPKTGKSVQYLMPSDTNMRTVFVDNSTTPVTFWVGSNHDRRIVKVEPLDSVWATKRWRGGTGQEQDGQGRTPWPARIVVFRLISSGVSQRPAMLFLVQPHACSLRDVS